MASISGEVAEFQIGGSSEPSIFKFSVPYWNGGATNYGKRQVTTSVAVTDAPMGHLYFKANDCFIPLLPGTYSSFHAGSPGFTIRVDENGAGYLSCPANAVVRSISVQIPVDPKGSEVTANLYTDVRDLSIIMAGTLSEGSQYTSSWSYSDRPYSYTGQNVSIGEPLTCRQVSLSLSSEGAKIYASAFMGDETHPRTARV